MQRNRKQFLFLICFIYPIHIIKVSITSIPKEHYNKMSLSIILCFKMVSFRGQKKLGPCPDWPPLGVYLKISNKHPRPFHMGVSPPPPAPLRTCTRVKVGAKDNLK